ncbi:MAG: GGDEF domain-containing protein [Wenzhouxiangellaceae bacterium]
MASTLIALAVAASAFVSVAAVAATPIGTPAIQHFAPGLDVYPRNFAVTQGPSGIVYVGNAEGVLSFDGTRWHRHATSDDELVRTLAHDGDGRLYVGGYNGFGYFETPLGPDSEYIDLVPEFGITDPDFADIWQLEITSRGVFFLALNTLFWLDPDTGATRRWAHPGRFGAIGEIDGEIFIQYRGEGLRVWRDGEFEPVANTQALSEQVYELLALPGGGFLTTARDGGWRIFRDGEVSEFHHPEALPQSSYFTSAAALDDGLIALGSIDGWLYFLDTVNHSFESFRLARDWIADLHATREGGLIAQTDLETLYIRWPAKWTAWGADHGLTGNVMEVLRWRDRWLVISNGGALMSTSAMPVDFEPTPWTDFEAWDFLPLDDGTGLFAESYVVKHVDLDGVIQEIDSVQYPRVIVPYSADESVFFVGTEDGLSVIRRAADGFEHVLSSTDDPGAVFSIVEREPGLLMLGTQGQGVFEARFDASFETLDLTERNQGIVYGDAEYADLALLGGQVHAVTEDSIWRFNGEDFEPARLEGLEEIRRQGRHLEVREGPEETLWAYDFGNLHRFTGRGWQEMDIGPLYRGALSSIDFDDTGRVFVGASGGVVIFDPGASELDYTGNDVMLRSVELDDRSGEIRHLTPGTRHSVPAGPFAIRFEYSLPGVNGRSEVRYKARLSGYEPDFTGWEPTSQYTYINLQPGEYAFEVLARGPSGRVSEIEPFEFRVVPPWHKAPWILNLRWPGVALLFALLIWLYMRARVWRLEGERKRLATKVRQRTQALVAANRKLKEMAEIDQLTGIANRRSFDQYLRQQIAQCHADRRPMALALIDLDQFKPYNDRHGHLAGDQVLRDIAHCLGEGFGNDESLIARFGGDEFAAVLPGRDLESARALAERARGYCAKACAEVNLSIGIAAVRPGRQVDSVGLLQAADHQLYEIKRAGRNGVATAWVDSD